MMRRIMFFFVLVFSGTAQATVSSGSVSSSSGGGMFATGSWKNGGAVLSYTVTDLGDKWKYVYNFSVTKKDLSHIIFQVGESFATANVLAGTTSGWKLGDWGNQGNSNPGIPSTLYGLKFDGDFSLKNSFTIFSDLAPMWGDFYAKDGKDGGSFVYSYNTNFGADAGPYQEYSFGKILVPSSHVSSVPEPTSPALFTAGIIGVAMMNRKKKVS